MRKLISVVMAAGIVVSLSACASGPFSLGGCTPSYTAGSNSELVTAKGQFKKTPNADFPTPLIAKDTQVSALTTGDGHLVAPGETVVVQVSIYSGDSGDLVISTDYSAPGLLRLAGDAVPEFGKVVQCEAVGSRVAAVGPASDLVGEAAITANNLPLADDDTVVLVVDLVGSYLGKANGADQIAQAGLPSIALAPDGRPGFTFPTGDIPTDLKIATLKAGNGEKVEKGDSVVVNYTGVLWDDKSVFDSTWERDAPTILLAESSADAATGGLVPGFAKALIGAKVGSQVLVSIPPEFGYPAGSGPATVPDGSTMVFVVDVLGIVKADD